MNYELAKELKEAGWPVNLYEETKEFSTIILSELIEACGKEFRVLKMSGGVWKAEPSLEAMKRVPGSVVIWGHTYSTPEEAVARLWLALNKK